MPLSPDQDSPDQDSPDQDSPDQDSADQDSPDQDSPDQDSPDQDSASPIQSSTSKISLELGARIHPISRVVIKIGSALLTPNGPLGEDPFSMLAHEIRSAQASGVFSTIVSSGSIAQGRIERQLSDRPKTLSANQALAAIGQPILMRRWAEALAPLSVAQFLLTQGDISEPLRFFNARRALLALEHAGVTPIGNENDTIATDEIKIGDNDTLSAYVARIISADLLVIYTPSAWSVYLEPSGSSSGKKN